MTPRDLRLNRRYKIDSNWATYEGLDNFNGQVTHRFKYDSGGSSYMFDNQVQFLIDDDKTIPTPTTAGRKLSMTVVLPEWYIQSLERHAKEQNLSMADLIGMTLETELLTRMNAEERSGSAGFDRMARMIAVFNEEFV